MFETIKKAANGVAKTGLIDSVFCNVHTTTDYGKFKILKGNRKINLHNFRRIKQSMREEQLVSIITVNERFEIIDGQHRYEACKELGLPVYYIVCKGYGLSEVQVLNTNMTNWTKKEYLNAYCDLGYPEYLKFREFMKSYPDFTIMSCCALLFNTAQSGSTAASGNEKGKKFRTRNKVFENGKLKIYDWNLAVRSADKIMMIKPLYNGFARQNFVLAMMSVFSNKNFNHSEFIGKLAYQSTKLVDCTTVGQYKTLIEVIYNHKKKDKINLRF